jgi:prophage tail gpP-like protein
MPKPQEVAVLEVNGSTFQDWETVWVQQRWADSFTYFRFTAAERDPIFTKQGFPLWQKLQFKPGDQCSITLAGQLAVTGFIETRQVAYDANQHGVMLIGKSATANAAKSSVDTKTGNFDNKNIVQCANEVCAPYGVGVKVIGSPDLTPFPKLQNEKGELVWDFLERIARPRGVVMGSDSFGNFLLIGQHSFPAVTELIEGVNIKSCQCIITIEHIYEAYEVGAQHPASDDNSGTAASELKGVAPGIGLGGSKLITPAEQPVKTDGEVQARANYERLWHDGTLVQCTIVAQGWLRDSENLWRAGDEVHVYSPMAMLDHQLKIQNATFTQDDKSGTQTTLDLVSPEYLRGAGSVNVGPGLGT